MQDTLEDTDIEEELSNYHGHGRIRHRTCPPLPPGIIIEAQCGALFRTQGHTSKKWSAVKCTACIKALQPSDLCLSCNNPVGEK